MSTEAFPNDSNCFDRIPGMTNIPCLVLAVI